MKPVFSIQQSKKWLYSIFCTCFLLVVVLLPQISHAQTANTTADSLYTQAQIALSMNNDIEKAEMLFQKIVQIQPKNATAYAELSRIYMYKRNFTDALKAIQKAAACDSANTTYQARLATILAETGHYNKAANLYLKLAHKKGGSKTFLLKAAWCYNKVKNYQKAISLINQFPIDSVDNKEQYLMAKFKLYAHLENIDSINSLAHQLLKTNPDKPEYYLIAGFSEEKLGHHKIAVDLMDTASKRFPKYPKVMQRTIMLYGKYDHQKLKKIYDTLSHAAIYTPKEKAILFFPLIDLSKKDSFAKNILDQKLPELAFGKPQNYPAIILYSEVLEANKKFTEAIAVCKKGLKTSSDSISIFLWNNLFRAYANAGKIDSIKKYNQYVLKKFPEHRMPYYYQADVNNSMGDTSLAIQNLEKAKRLPSKDSIIRDIDIYTYLGNLYQSMNQNDSAEVNFKAATKTDLSNPITLNNYSYLLAQEGKDLDNALFMVSLAVVMKPHTSFILDTYGWVLYKLKKYKEARVYIQKAIKYSEKPDAYLYEHLGDVENAMGKHRKARKHWRKAIELGGNPTTLMKKIKQ